MQLVAADVGNSSVKLAQAEWNRQEGAFRLQGRGTSVNPEELRGEWFEQWLAGGQSAKQWVVSSVNAHHARTLHELAAARQIVEHWYEVTVDDVLLRVDVENPRATGIDRLLAAQAAHLAHAGDRDTIVIDCGTALTIDLVTRDNTFRGGVILPGPRTGLRALASMTAALPDLSGEEIVRPAEVPGRSTREAMMAGAWLMGLGAIRECVSRLSRQLDQPPDVIATGGALDAWRNEWPPQWKIVDNLVIEGLLQIARVKWRDE